VSRCLSDTRPLRTLHILRGFSKTLAHFETHPGLGVLCGGSRSRTATSRFEPFRAHLAQAAFADITPQRIMTTTWHAARAAPAPSSAL